MRQGQQNRRGRGRNRKSQNPLTRSFESTGPDVKLRGTPNHIAEKYMTLARDAQSSGDPVLAENYMQHAEHYNRIIMSFREQMGQAGGDPYAGGAGRGMGGEGMDGGDDYGDEEGDDYGAAMGPQGASMGPSESQPAMPQQAPVNQPRFDQPQRFDNRHQHQHQHRRDQHQRQNNPRHDRNDNRYDRHDRAERQDFRRDRGDQFDRGLERSGNGGEARGFRDERPPQQGPVPHEPNGEPAPRRRERFQGSPAGQSPGQGAEGATGGHHQQPEFLRRPVRRVRPEPEDAGSAPPQPLTDEQD